MRFGYTILYVRDVAASVDLYERAFGQRRRFVHRLLPGLTRPAAPTCNGPGSTLASASYR